MKLILTLISLWFIIYVIGDGTRQLTINRIWFDLIWFDSAKDNVQMWGEGANARECYNPSGVGESASHLGSSILEWDWTGWTFMVVQVTTLQISFNTYWHLQIIISFVFSLRKKNLCVKKTWFIFIIEKKLHVVVCSLKINHERDVHCSFIPGC